MADRNVHSIVLSRTPRGWVATFSDPEVARLFGGKTIPTAYTAACKPEVVFANISALNPHCIVEMGYAGGAA